MKERKDGKGFVRRLLPKSLGGPPDNMYNALAGYVLNLVFKNLLSLLILRMKTVPTKIMEIGVAEGDGAELIITTCKKRGARNIRYYGFDLFETTKKKDVMERLKKPVPISDFSKVTHETFYLELSKFFPRWILSI